VVLGGLGGSGGSKAPPVRTNMQAKNKQSSSEKGTGLSRGGKRWEDGDMATHLQMSSHAIPSFPVL